MPTHPDRKNAVSRLKRRLLRLHSPRLHMVLIVLLACVAGFLFCALLLVTGMTTLWLRYGLGVAFAYAVFLLLVYLWVRSKGRGWDDGLYPDGGEGSGCGGSSTESGSGWDMPDFDAGDACIVVAAICLLVLLAGYSLYFVWEAPALLAELLIEAGFAGGLYRGLKSARPDRMFRTALSRTWIPFAVMAILLMGLGKTVQLRYPQALTLGQAIYEMKR